ncbi:MAG: response regulator [Clostridiales bacterium]|nr:response regulator [Clostridiales bacterium]
MNTVLIVEDEKMIRKGIKAMVQRSGVPVDVIIECNNGLMALDILKNQNVDVMFTDIRMPKMDGIELVKEVQKLKHKPIIIAISGYDEFSYAVELLRMGAREYILKPVDRNTIRDILERFDKEIKDKKEKHNEIHQILHNQLKLLILNKNISLHEIDIITKEYDYCFSNTPYVICCVPKSNNSDYDSKQYIFLNDVNNTDIYIVPEKNIRYLLLNELKDKYVGISSSHKGIDSLGIAYKEAIQARKLAFLNCDGYYQYQEDKMGRYSVKEEVTENSAEVVQKLMEAISQKIGTDKYNIAIKEIERLKYNTIRGKYTIDSLSTNISILIDEILKLYQNVLDIEDETLFGLKDCLSYPSIEDYFNTLISWVEKLGKEINTEFEDYTNKHKIHTAIKFIKENYNKDLNMAVVSNYVSMNYSLFSYVFKEYTGHNFVHYLKNLRINEAKILLEDTNLKVNEISQQVGYNNEKHFMKIFKETCGVSPSEYRRNTQLKKDII